jgi:hypothetical protein
MCNTSATLRLWFRFPFENMRLVQFMPGFRLFLCCYGDTGAEMAQRQVCQKLEWRSLSYDSRYAKINLRVNHEQGD